MNTKNIPKISLFTALIIICSQIAIPIGTVPITLQTVAVFLCAALLGAKNAFSSTFIYILLGVFGLPVFSGAKVGIGVLFGATGGFIFGLIAAALIIGSVSQKPIKYLIVSMVFSLFTCYIFGTLQYILFYSTGLYPALCVCVFPFIIPDTIKIIITIILYKSIMARVN